MHRNAGNGWPQALRVGYGTGAALLTALMLGGCATQYRPVVAAINPVGPAGQPQKYAYAVSDPNEGDASGTLNGLLTIVDVSGDTTIATPALIPQPTYFAVNTTSQQGFVVNAQSSLNAVNVANPNGLISSNVVQTTLPSGFSAPSISSFTFGSSGRILIPLSAQPVGSGQPGAVAIFSSTSPALQQQISVSPGPVYVVGADGTPRAYAISSGTSPGQVSAIESSSLSVSNTITVGNNPVYGVETTDTRRAFILNQGSGTVSVINVTNNALDNVVPTIQLDPSGTLGLQPVWADIAPATNQLVVVSKRAADANGYLSVISIPLCNALAQPTNTSCDANNPTDGVGFGQVLATVPIGVNPTQVSVLSDGSQAFVSNQGRLVSPELEGSVSAVNLVSMQVTATIGGATAYSSGGVPNPISTPTCNVTAIANGASQACVYGHPTTIAATTGTPTGKVYVTSPDSNYMTVIETDTDTVNTHIDLQGTGLRVQLSAR